VRRTIASVWLVILAIGLIQTANGLQTDLLGMRADLEAFPAWTIGLIMASYYVGYTLAPLMGRMVIGRFGHVTIIASTATIAGVIIVVHAFAVTALIWAMLRVISGFALSLLYVAAESWINARVENRLRGRVFSIYMVVQMIAMTLAQGLLSTGSPRTAGLFILSGLLFAAGGVPVLFAGRAAPHRAPPDPFGIVKLFRVSPMGVIVTVLAGVSWSVLFTFGPVYAQRSGFGLGGVSLFMGLAMVGGAVCQFPFGWLSDLIGRRPTIAAMSAAAVAASLFGIWADAHGAATKYVAAALLGAFVFPLYAISAAQINDRIAPESRIGAAAGLVLLFGLGSIFGPLLCGWTVSALGPAGFFAGLAAVMAGVVAVATVAR
jgi:MFS family permease